MKILFVTWDGPQSSYLESLFLPIFKKLREDNIYFHILQFTWDTPERVQAIRTSCVNAGCTYEVCTVNRTLGGLASFTTAIYGALLINRAIRVHGIDALMPRSTMPALATLLSSRGKSMPMIFDADGLPLDERVDFAGRSSSGLVHRYLRDIEAQALKRASVVLTRSYSAIEILKARAGAGSSLRKYYVVSNGRDENDFRPLGLHSNCTVREELGVGIDDPIIIYAGSLGGKYCISELFRFHSYVQRHNTKARLVLLTASTQAVLDEIEAGGWNGDRIICKYVAPEEVSKYLSAGDVGLSVIKPSYSMQAVSAIKTGEYLLCGLPVIGTKGIGDSDKVCSEGGYALNDTTDVELQKAARWFSETVMPSRELYRTRCREVGLKYYSLNKTLISYRESLSLLL